MRKFQQIAEVSVIPGRGLMLALNLGKPVRQISSAQNTATAPSTRYGLTTRRVSDRR